ncbi:MAG: tetratricopeptide repeat protein [Ignavibacteriales bacterium]|nr:MAG: tetratricopeptide repeat protein [Ignavibacteriales bacterium]
MLVTERSALFNKNFLLLFLIIIFFQKNFGQVYPDKSIHKILKSGINLIIDQKYDEAEKLFKQLDQTRKDIPLGKIYLAAVYIAKAYDYEEPYDDELITKHLEGAKKISERLLKSDEKNIWSNYFLALTEGYIAYYDALRESWLQAFSTGLSSVSGFEDCLEIDKNFHESLIAIGSYKFWKSKKTEFINWLPFVEDEKELGIKYLQNAIKYSGYNSHLAIHSLIWIYVEQKDFNDAIKVAELALKEHPQSRIFKWGLARSYENIDPAKSVELYREILHSYPKKIKSNKINEVTLKHIIAQQLIKINKITEALIICDEILSIKGYSKYELDKISSRLERVKSLKQELN